jgi:putative ABC transport system ATP-binding protein
MKSPFKEMNGFPFQAAHCRSSRAIAQRSASRHDGLPAPMPHTWPAQRLPSAGRAPADARLAAPVLAVEAINVVRSYAAGEVAVQAVRGVNFALSSGELTAIVGPSGCGKSTLLSMLGAIETPTSGQILIGGVEVAALSDYDRTLMRRRKIGFVFQAYNLMPTLTAIENVALPLELDGVRARHALERACAALEQVGLGHRRDHLPSMLSGGEQQRVAVARALITQPTLLLADEPTGNLDSAGGEQIMRLIRGLVSELGQTVVLVTHDRQIAASADRVLCMRDGLIEDDRRISADGGSESRSYSP